MEKVGSDTGKKKRSGWFGKIKESVRGSVSLRRGVKEAPVLDITAFVVALLFARCHVVFGSHPLATAWLAILPSRVWIALAGAIVGSLTLGKQGIIYIVISLIVVFLRVIVSATDKPGEGKTKIPGARALFGESLLLRMSASIIGGFVSAVYEVLLSGFGSATVLYGLSMILLPPLVAFTLSGLFDTPVTLRDVFRSDSPIFAVNGGGEKRRFNLIFLQVSCLLAIFLISFSMRELELFGITFSYIFAGVLTFFSAKRFGSVRAAAVGFAATLAISPTYSVAYALLGLCAGALFKLGLVYALIGAGCAVAAWGAYSGGLVGFLSVFPEFALSAMIASPIVGKLPREVCAESELPSQVSAKDMVGTMSLAYKNRYSGIVDGLESSLLGLSEILNTYNSRANLLCHEELRDLVTECADRYCDGCSGDCNSAVGRVKENRDSIAEILSKKGAVTADELSSLGVGECAHRLAEAITRAVAILTEEKYKSGARDTTAEDMELISRLITESRLRDESERSYDTDTAALVEGAMKESGLTDGAVAVFGRRKKHLILAAPDADGGMISSESLREKIEELANIHLGEPEYFKKDNMALMECSAQKLFSAEYSTLARSGDGGEVSGDTHRAADTESGHFISVLSDGMGSGECAKEVSSFATDFIADATRWGAPGEILIRMLNNATRRRHGECTATLDLCSVDLYNGECVFIKCGAAPSYIKRGSSIFRIRARTAPLGVLKNTDAEKIKATLEDGDFIIMLSDGIIGDDEDSPWLIELLAKADTKDTDELARLVIDGAKMNVTAGDDMTAIAIRIKKE